MSEKHVPWSTLEFLPENKQDTPFGYVGMGKPGGVFTEDIFDKSKPRPCSKDALVNAISTIRKIGLVWTPASQHQVPPECVDFLHDAVKERNMAAAKNEIKMGCLNTTLWGGLCLHAAVGMKTLPTVGVLLLLAFGIIPLVFGVYHLHLAKKSIATFEEAACDALYPYWIARTFPKFLAYFVAVIIAIAVLQMIVGLADSVEAAGLVKERVRSGEIWRLLTYSLLHGGVLHILFNALVLFSVGKAIVALSHKSVLGIVFLASALSGSVFSLVFSPETTSIGASGGILGCIGFLTVFAYRRRALMPSGFLKDMIIWIAAIACLGIICHDIIDNAAHLGGLVAGVGVGILLMWKASDEIPFVPPKAVEVLGHISWAVLIAVAFLTAILIMI